MAGASTQGGSRDQPESCSIEYVAMKVRNAADRQLPFHLNKGGIQSKYVTPCAWSG